MTNCKIGIFKNVNFILVFTSYLLSDFRITLVIINLMDAKNFFKENYYFISNNIPLPMKLFKGSVLISYTLKFP